jgi:G-patch protein/R3H domain-containing protein
MDANARKIIHEVANRFKIKSKSTGAGANRRPVLHRTKNTVSFAEIHFESTMARTQRRKLARPSGRAAAGAQPRAAGAGGGRVNHAAVTVKEGEVVGGSAPEIGTANKGRKLLEKMGWSSGDALGAVDNKGRTAPIEHIVKRSRMGLG